MFSIGCVVLSCGCRLPATDFLRAAFFISDIHDVLSGFTLINILALAWKWLTALALLFWIGILVSERFIYDDKEQHVAVWLHASRRRTDLLQWFCLATALVGEIVMLVLHLAQNAQLQQNNVFSSTLLNQTLFHSTYGFLWIVQIVLILGLQSIYWWITYRQRHIDLTRKPAYGLFIIISLMFAALLLLAYTLTEEATRSTAQFHDYALILNWLSFVAQCGWFGVVVYLTYVLLPSLPTLEPAHRVGILLYGLRRVARLILISSGVLCVCELYLSEVSLSSIQQFTTAPYGYVLLTQWIVIIIMLIFNAYAFFSLYPKLNKAVVWHPNTVLAAQPIRQTALDRIAKSFGMVFHMQSWLGGLVLFCTALMTFFITPGTFLATNNSQYSSPGNILTATPTDTLSAQTKEVGNLSVTLIVTPANVDVVNTITVKLTDRRSGKPVTNAHIEISTNMAIMDMGTVQATMTADGLVYRATFQPYITFSMSGVWNLTLMLQLPGQAPHEVVFAVLFLSNP